MTARPAQAMILAAGRGTRMKQLTNAIPKPLICVADKPLIDHVLDKITTFGITQCVVNLCYLGEKIQAHLQHFDTVHFAFSHEDEALETGGGVKKALPLLGNDPFFVLNSDPIWTEPTEPALTKLSNAFDPETMDAILLFAPMTHVFGHDGTGDYFINEQGLPRRKRADESSAPYVYAGAQILHPRLFKNAPEGKFPLVRLYDQAQSENRLGCVVLDGDWFHVGTPEAHALAEKTLRSCC